MEAPNDTILYTDPLYSLLTFDRSVNICSAGHICHGAPQSYGTAPIRFECTMCNILNTSRKHNKQQIVLVSNTYIDGDRNFEATCDKNHRFIINESTAHFGCRVCYALSTAMSKYNSKLIAYTHCLYIHENSHIRLQCKNIIHNPNCENVLCKQLSRSPTLTIRKYAANCNNFIACNMDFYASSHQLKYNPAVLNCNEHHIPPSQSAIVATKRAFEVLFGTRFDDNMFGIHGPTGAGIEFTGYNKSMGVAFTHLSDKIPRKCCLVAQKWCFTNEVAFIIIPEDIVRSKDIDRVIIDKLSALELIAQPQYAYQRLRHNLHYMNSTHQLFPSINNDSQLHAT